MSYLLDTNVISELVRSKPNESVLAWFSAVPDDTMYLSVLTLGEIRKGVEKIADVRKEKLRLWLESELPKRFAERLLTINAEVADRWGRLQHQMARPVPAVDSLLAATALYYDLRIVTRNSKDFDFPGLEVINPWVE